ncbi:hypothetical protein thsps21_48680 [Pseudomonas sp. No.21]|nr:hypothetical protein TUM20249_55480 [Pseudomonas tohonis]
MRNTLKWRIARRRQFRLSVLDRSADAPLADTHNNKAHALHPNPCLVDRGEPREVTCDSIAFCSDAVGPKDTKPTWAPSPCSVNAAHAAAPIAT